MASLAPTRYQLDRAALAGQLDGEPRYRVDQVWDGLYRRLGRPEELKQRVPPSARPPRRRARAGAHADRRVAQELL